MKDILVLLVLLNALTNKVCSQPYKADSDGNCLNKQTEYLLDDSDLCCKRCPPGERLIKECSETTDTVCEPCPKEQYIKNWNFSPKCFSCNKCTRGLQEALNCSSATNRRCVCQPGRYCLMGFDDPYCRACSTYTLCRVGHGVSVPGTGTSDVRCEQCPDGTFSNTTSSTDPCRPHTNCHGGVVVKQGDATSDTVCEPPLPNVQPQVTTKEPRIETVFTTASTVTITVSATTDSEAAPGPTDSVQSISTSVSEVVFNYSTTSPPPGPVSASTLAAVIAGVTGFILFIMAFILLFLCKKARKKDAAILNPKVDANGNCESGDKINQGYLVETQLTSFTETSPEQQCLLQNGEAGRDHSQSSNNTTTLTQTDGSQESIGPLQSTLDLHSPLSALSEPMTLLSNTEPVPSQTSVPTQSSSQPTSPQVISPVTSPHVNVNITFHIGNGSCGTPSVIPTDSMQVDSKLRFGEEEESFSIPQQEAGKQSLVSVQESESYST